MGYGNLEWRKRNNVWCIRKNYCHDVIGYNVFLPWNSYGVGYRDVNGTSSKVLVVTMKENQFHVAEFTSKWLLL